ncbi:MAG: hypothetical protein V4671_17325 [Armatimonadota bacterium]
MEEKASKTGSETDNVKTESFRRVFLIWTAVAFVLGAAGSFLGNVMFSAPYYFGFFVIFTLVGLSGLFALAVLVDKSQNERR